MSYTIKVKLCLVIHLMCELQSPKAAITGGDTGLSKSPKHKQTLNLWSFVLRVFNPSVKSFAPMKKDLSSNTCLSLDSCPELLPREYSSPTKNRAWPALLVHHYPFYFKTHTIGKVEPALVVASTGQAVWTLGSECLQENFHLITD